MTHIHKRPRKIAALANDMLGLLAYHDATFSELKDAYSLAFDKAWRKIEKKYKIPCPTCKKNKP